jgi:hypothetical protein
VLDRKPPRGFRPILFPQFASIMTQQAEIFSASLRLLIFEDDLDRCRKTYARDRDTFWRSSGFLLPGFSQSLLEFTVELTAHPRHDGR